MRWAIAMVALIGVACGGDSGTGEEPLIEYKLRHFAGVWEGDSDCADGRYRFDFDPQLAGYLYVTGKATLFEQNDAGQCVASRTDDVTATVGAGGAVSVFWPPVGAPVDDRMVYRSWFTSVRHFSRGSLTLERRTTAVGPGEFAMTKQ